jgi:hypothetical protein
MIDSLRGKNSNSLQNGNNKPGKESCKRLGRVISIRKRGKEGLPFAVFASKTFFSVFN